MNEKGLTAVPGIRVGHFTLTERPTGCTVVVVEKGAVGAVDVRGGAPATRETDLLRSENTVQEVHAVLLTGGSAYGLDAAGGVMRYLEERNVGFPVGVGVVPIVVGAALFDLSVGGKPTIRPTAECGYQAAKVATTGPVEEGNVGAGAGSTVGKTAGGMGAMKGGIGTASIELPNGLIVSALVAVNAVGDIVDPATGKIIAGVRGADGKLADVRKLLRDGSLVGDPLTSARQNTTIGVIATNATLDQAQATRVAVMGHDGMARTIVPSHTPSDGDALFVLATGDLEGAVNVGIVGALAAEVVAEAILRGVRAARGLDGLPSAADLAKEP